MKKHLSKILPAFVALGILGFTAFSVSQSRNTEDKVVMAQPQGLQLTEIWQVKFIDSPTQFTVKEGWFNTRKIRVCGVAVTSDKSQAAINYLTELITESEREVGVVFLAKDGEEWITEVYANLGKLPEDFVGEQLITKGFATLTDEAYSCPNGESLRLAQEELEEKSFRQKSK